VAFTSTPVWGGQILVWQAGEPAFCSGSASITEILIENLTHLQGQLAAYVFRCSGTKK
jgi:hypothetical protein